MNVKKPLVFYGVHKALFILNAIVVPPIFLHYLGSLEFGIFGFLFLISGVVNIMEMGIGRAVTHAYAKASTNEHTENILRTIEMIIWPIGLIVFALLINFWEFIGESWLAVDDKFEIKQIIFYIALFALGKWLVIFYRSVLLGREQHGSIIILSILDLSFSSLGGIVLLLYAKMGVTELLMWYSFIAISSSVLFFLVAWRNMSSFRRGKFSFYKLRELWNFSYKVAIIAFMGGLLMQADKLIASIFLPLEIFGWFTLLSRMTDVLAMLTSPIQQVSFPRFTKLLEVQEVQKAQVFYNEMALLSSTLVFPIAITLAFHADGVLTLYTQNKNFAIEMGSTFVYLIIAKSFLNLGMLPYAWQMAKKEVSFSLIVNAFLLGTVVPLSLLLVYHFGVDGLGLSWLFSSSLFVLFLMARFHQKCFQENYYRWAGRYVFPFILSTLVVNLLSNVSVDLSQGQWYQKIAVYAIVIVISSLLAYGATRMKLKKGH